MFIFIILFLLIEARLYYWQIVKADELSRIGAQQYGAETKVLPSRGLIMASDGYKIAANKINYLLFANPKVIKDRDEISEKLTPLLNIETSTISAALKRKTFYSPLKSGLNEDLKNKIVKMKITGLDFEESQSRFYPEASMAAHLLGFVGKDENGEPKGYFGLEGYYDRQLRGKPGISMRMQDAWGNPVVSKLNEFSGKVDGRSLVLHLDRTVQFVLEQELKKGIIKYGAVSGMGGIIDPKTGGILAMASLPNYDPGEYYKFSDDNYKNPFLSDTYEPGSTFKPIIMASALEEGLVKHDTVCSICGGPVEIEDYTIRTWNDKYRPGSNMTDVIVHSDNTGMVFVGRKLGLDRMLNYLDSWGIGNYTGVDLQGEESPVLRARDSWYPIDLATATFGQGITVTPLQLLTSFAAIANGGARMEPHAAAEIVTANGEKIEIPPKKTGQPISEKTAKIMTEMLVNAVNKGEAKWVSIKGYRVAGKTGTAQIPIAGHYDAHKTITSFIGFAPADDPKFVMLIVLNRPSTSIYGSETAAPVFFNVAKKLFTYYEIAPTETKGNLMLPADMDVVDDFDVSAETINPNPTASGAAN